MIGFFLGMIFGVVALAIMSVEPRGEYYDTSNKQRSENVEK